MYELRALVAAWLAMWGALAAWIVELGLGWGWAARAVTGINLVVAAVALLRVRSLGPLVALPDTVRRLGVTDSARREKQHEAHRSDPPPTRAKLDALIDVAERNVRETDRRVRAGAATLATAWRERAGDAVRWSTLALGGGVPVLVLYRAFGGRRGHAGRHTPMRGAPAGQVTARGAAAPEAPHRQSARPDRGALARLASFMLPIALRSWRTLLRDAPPRAPTSGAESAPPPRPAA